MKTKNIFSVIAMFAVVMALGVASVSAQAAKNNKYGLFIGINDYPGDSKLLGCVSDAKNYQKTMVMTFGFNEANTTLLLDQQATRQGIINQLLRLQMLAKSGDFVLITYSGHGTLFPDAYSEELDETKKIQVVAEGVTYAPLDIYDSAICPIDSDAKTSGKTWGNLILDDELNAIFTKMTIKGVNVVFISDSCHSGTIGREIKDNSKMFDSPKLKFMPPARAFKAERYSDIRFTKPKKQTRVTKKQTQSGRLLVMSGAQDDQFSLDVTLTDGSGTGLFTYFVLETIRVTNGKVGYKDMMTLVQAEVLKNSIDLGGNQNPQLDLRFFTGNPNIQIFGFR